MKSYDSMRPYLTPKREVSFVFKRFLKQLEKEIENGKEKQRVILG
jgi:hypothetical protein